ncbi:MAG: bifunctional adenosylcobinamide kinase/adenosylcobinamide-phosphate guanylyltransferase [Deltaproteobacteria bacterium]|nr:MAG: bifunctional adenosylcobinamide kinase/adenosylcobinamide-phosphate guanylyltransferase [Deltaproteobacteria bacterium]
MHAIFYVTGGCRSGKTRFAMDLAESTASSGRVYLATCEPVDAEMKRRVARHRNERGSGWRTVEEPLDLTGTLTRIAGDASVVLIDCFTLWVSNRMMAGDTETDIRSHAKALMEVIGMRVCPVVMVSNEVGWGIVPEHPLSRAFRDILGEVNQFLARAADTAVLMASGMPVYLKGSSVSSEVR